MLDAFAVAAPGLERIVAEELRGIGVNGRVVAGGVEWTASRSTLYAANLHLRSASRVVARLARFRARSFIELERRLKRIDWSAHVGRGDRVSFQVTSKKSKLYHEGAIQERFARVVAEETECDSSAWPRDDTSGSELETEGIPAAQLFIVRFQRDECLVSADTSGAHLHRRGYRLAVGRAPLRETIAAAVLLASGWDPARPLLDPFCGSGTIPIEGALLARNIPPGMANPGHEPRAYAFQRRPDFDPDAWREVVESARRRIRAGRGGGIVGTDRDEGAIEAARANAVRAGLEDADVRFEVSALTRVRPLAGPGWIVTNPPYGVRIGERRDLRDLYAAVGNWKRQKAPEWEMAILSADPALAAQLGFEWEERLRTVNGGVPVRLLIAATRPRAPAPAAP